MPSLLSNLVVWVHTCPQRKSSLDETLASIDQSDLPIYRVLSAGEHGKPYSWTATIEWWLDRWLEMAALGEWVLRLEDDVIVSKHIRHNLETWPAILEPDFGMGIGFIFDWLVRDLGGIEFLPNKVVRSKAVAWAGGQAQLMPSRVTTQIVPLLRSNLHSANRSAKPSAVWLDTIITQELTRNKYRTYLHVPSLVRTSSLSTISVASVCARSDHYATKTWLGDWIRPKDQEEEFQSEVLLCGKRTRWAVLNDGTVHRVSTPANLDPVAGPVTINGRLGVLRSSCLHDSSRAAYAAAATMLQS